MRNLNKLMLGVAACAILSFQTPAQAAGYMAAADDYGLVFAALGEISGGYRHADSSDYVNMVGGMVSGAGRVSIPLHDRFSVQIDGDAETYFITGDQSWEPSGLWLAGGHASWRDPMRGLFGAFAATGYGLQTNFDNSTDYELGYLVGLEGQVYLDALTFYAQAGYADFEADNEPEGFIEGWFVRGVGRWFPSDDSMVEAELAYGHTSQFVDGSDNGNILNWGLQGKMRITESMPIYATAAYRGGYYDATSEDDDGSEHMFTVGFNVLFGPRSLKDNDRRGATLDLPRLPARAAPWGEGLD